MFLEQCSLLFFFGLYISFFGPNCWTGKCLNSSCSKNIPKDFQKNRSQYSSFILLYKTTPTLFSASMSFPFQNDMIHLRHSKGFGKQWFFFFLGFLAKPHWAVWWSAAPTPSCWNTFLLGEAYFSIPDTRGLCSCSNTDADPPNLTLDSVANAHFDLESCAG